MAAVAIVSITASGVMARGRLAVFAKLTDHDYAAVIATTFLAVTMAWGPVAMSYLHWVTAQTGPDEPMPVALPLNAFFVFPWLASLPSIAVVTIVGSCVAGSGGTARGNLEIARCSILSPSSVRWRLVEVRVVLGDRLGAR